MILTKQKENKILRSAIRTFGITHQLNIAIEELSELTKEICKYNRYQSNVDAIAEEIADVEIMLQQIKMAFGLHNATRRWRNKKLNRLWGTINKERLLNGFESLPLETEERTDADCNSQKPQE